MKASKSDRIKRCCKGLYSWQRRWKRHRFITINNKFKIIMKRRLLSLSISKRCWDRKEIRSSTIKIYRKIIRNRLLSRNKKRLVEICKEGLSKSDKRWVDFRNHMMSMWIKWTIANSQALISLCLNKFES